MRVCQIAAAVLVLCAFSLAGHPSNAARQLGAESSSLGETRARVQDAIDQADPWLPVQTFLLDNGVRFYVVHRPFATTIAAGWLVRAGGADDAPGHTGVAHLVEHLLFQGSLTIGTKNWQREQDLLEEEERLVAAMQQGSKRRTSSRRTSSHRSLQQENLEAVRRNLRVVQRPGELARLWAEGAVQGTGALTTKDFSFYTGSFPKERLEAWMWLEVDRLAQPSMRGMQREKGVVLEESLQRVAGVSRGASEVEFDAFFWGSSPYHLSTDGVAGEMEASVRSDVLAFHRAHYRPENIAVSLVGDLDLASVKELAMRYFGRLVAEEKMAAGEAHAKDDGQFAAQPGGSVFRRHCPCRPSVRIRFPTVAYGHPDAVALDVLAAILNGRSGRLFRNLVQGQLAFAAYATHKAQARAGSFSLVVEANVDGAQSTAGSGALERLQAALLREVAGLRGAEGIGELELQRARNMLRAEAAREIKASDALRTRLLIDDGLGDGSRLREWPERLEQVSLGQLHRIVEDLLATQRGVTFYLEDGQTENSYEQ